MPIGTIIAWASSTLPNNENGVWLVCNGQTVNSTLYPDLYALMPNTPDYRGVFLRGYGSTTSTHYGTVTHTSGSLGALQGDCIRNLYGDFSSYATGSYGHMEIMSGIFANSYPGGQYGSSGTSSFGNMTIRIDASLVTPVANEIRPINKSVIYLIKAK